MAFLNQYIKSDNYNYSDVIQSGNFIFGLGDRLITKIDLNGNVIWEKTYSGVSFFKKGVKADNGDLLIEGYITGTSKSITRINTDGVVIWSKKYVVPSTPEYIEARYDTKLLKLEGDAYILFITLGEQQFSPSTQYLESNYILKIDGSGNITVKKKVSLPVSTPYNGSVAITTDGIRTLLIISRTTYLEFIFLDSALNIYQNQPLQINNAANTDQIYICDVNYVDTKFVFNGQIKKGSITLRRSFIGKISLPGSGQTLTGNVAVTLLSEDTARCYFAGESGNYFLSQTDYNNGRNIVKVDASFNVQWFKSLKTHTRAIRCTSGYLLFGGDDILARLDLDLTSCKTTNLPPLVSAMEAITYGTKHAVTLTVPATTVETLEVTVSPTTSQVKDVCVAITPAFHQVGPICAGSPFGPLPTTSLNGISGSWSPVVNNQATTTYTFNPVAGSNATTVTMTVVVTQPVTPIFTQVPPIYAGTSVAPLTTTSLNGITGSWLPAINNQATTTYSFTPDKGQCATGASMTIVVKNWSLQSSHLYLQAAGSEGIDSTKGVHVRWAFKEALAEHLPKGDYASNSYRFNKPDDYVKIYRAEYKPVKVMLDFETPPNSITDITGQKIWIYSVNGKIFHVHFKDIVKYNQVKAILDPNNDPSDFIRSYGDSLLEIETKRDLSFKITPEFVAAGGTGTIRVELLSVEENKITAAKAASLRKTYSLATLNQTPLVAENIRSIRFRSVNSFVHTIAFEFYADFINESLRLGSRVLLGKYALTTDDAEAFRRLEPQRDSLKTWLRYNDQAYVNPLNYRNRWNSQQLPLLERISNAVGRYITLSNELDNPKAVEIFPFENQSQSAACSAINSDYDPYIPEVPTAETGIEISYLEILQLGSIDFHNARMLGLGTLDLDQKVFNGQFIYIAEYVTLGDLGDGLGAREVQHLYCSLPTSLRDQRLPMPLNIDVPVPGRFFNNGIDDSEVLEQDVEDVEQADFSSVELTEDGYTPDGKTRYYTFYTQRFHDEEYDAPFYYTSQEFIAAESTYPVLAGLEYRKTGETQWIKPELSNNPDYFNIDQSGISTNKRNETLEIVIPDPGKPLFSHAVKESGKLDYTSYGINWFSRARYGALIHTVETLLRPANQLLPPTNVSATLIQKEKPLLLTTAVEQKLYEDISLISNDKTLVRLTFEYNHAQELIDYHHKINGEVVNNYFETPNGREAFADEIQLYFRDRIPSSVYGKIRAVTPQANPLLLKIETEPYIVLSQGINDNIIPQTVPPTYNEVYTPYIAPGDEDNFIGSILLVDNVEYLIQEVNLSGSHPGFTILKSGASGAMLNINSGSTTENNVPDPVEGAFFTAVENMQNISSWDLPAQIPFKVKIDHIAVHREEEIIIENSDCSTETHVQKFRGIYHEASVERWLEKVDDDGDGYFDVESGSPEDPENDDFVLKHRGLYRITFNGFSLPQHSQYVINNPPGSHSVEWYNGVVRLHTLSNAGNTPRKEFKVIRTENINTSSNLVLYVQDLTFPSNEGDLENYAGKVIADGSNSNSQKVNFYPGYKVYLYKDDGLKLNSGTVMPSDGQDIRYSIFGLRSKDAKNEFPYDNAEDWFSKFSVPAIMYANAVIEPVKPQKPSGGLYATRPDYFGKSTYTFTNRYGSEQQIHKPYAVQFNRASDVQFLSAIYDTTVKDNDAQNLPVLNTLQYVMKNIFLEGEETWYVDRWNDLLGFEYESGEFAVFEGRQLPIPDNSRFIAGINAFIDEHNRFYNLTGSDLIGHLEPGFNLNTVVIPANPPVNAVLQVKDFLKDALLSCFVPLTEIPVVYNYVNGNNYTPIPKQQVIRDRDGNLLKPTDTNFDMAPMMKRLDPPGQQYQSQFTDFGLDGASNAKYFYAVREMNNQFAASPYSEILGPVSLVNTAPPVAPQILKVVPVLENRVLGVAPKIQLQLNSYPRPQHVVKASIYRTLDPSLSLSVRTMDLVEVIDLEEEDIVNDPEWILEDSFEDLPEVPFGDPLFYRMTVSRRIRYNNLGLDTVIEYAPSEASKLIIANVAENYSPVSPTLDYFSEPLTANNELHSVILHWQKACYKGRYHIYQMNNLGNWVKIHELQTNDNHIYLPLADTQLNTGTLAIQDSEGNMKYHRFKVIAENTAGMLSREEQILTIYLPEEWQDIGGIGEMSIGNTFIIR